MNQIKQHHPKYGDLIQIGDRYRIREYKDKWVVVDRIKLRYFIEEYEFLDPGDWELALVSNWGRDKLSWLDYDDALSFVRGLESAV